MVAKKKAGPRFQVSGKDLGHKTMGLTPKEVLIKSPVSSNLSGCPTHRALCDEWASPRVKPTPGSGPRFLRNRARAQAAPEEELPS
jgi:hypothetical protein